VADRPGLLRRQGRLNHHSGGESSTARSVQFPLFVPALFCSGTGASAVAETSIDPLFNKNHEKRDEE